ncbi:ninjurin-B-like [Uloborus diversus]|uniref:ninjurin-B-like n=1 Tax=Uloborus diversus TaxID=327109 RepID=UPI00240A3DF5|nr:ninjurin-B-like [Uloborus diversus]
MTVSETIYSDMALEAARKLFAFSSLSGEKQMKDKSKESNKSNGETSLKMEIIPSSTDDAKATETKVTANDFGSQLMTRRITIAGGFLDIALFTANCEQLKFVLELGNFHIYYQQVLGLIITSLILQLLVGFTMFLLGCKVLKKTSDETYNNFLNHSTMVLVTLITVVNIFISTFGPKGTIMARCLGAFAYPNSDGPMWNAFLNFTRDNMENSNIR